jgi:hypothetical protein
MANADIPPRLYLLLRDHYVTTLKTAVAAGKAKHMVIPYCVIWGFILPALYLSIPHTRRPWLYNARWLVASICVGFSLKMVHEVSSTNMALSYATGLLGAWSIMSSTTFLIWTKPQFEAERVAKRKKSVVTTKGNPDCGNGTIIANGESVSGLLAGNGTELKKRENGHIDKKARKKSTDEEIEEYEFYWQPYPENGTFLERLRWSIDLVTNFTLAG